MEIDDLKNAWQNAGEPDKTISELGMMTELKRNTRLKRMRLRLLTESVLVFSFVLLFYNGLDGSDKPIWTSIMLVISGLLYIVNRVIGLSTISLPKTDMNALNMSTDLLRKLKKLSISSSLSAFFFGGTLILFLTISIEFNREKYAFLAVLIIGLLLFTMISYKIWKQQIFRLQQVIGQLSEDLP